MDAALKETPGNAKGIKGEVYKFVGRVEGESGRFLQSCKKLLDALNDGLQKADYNGQPQDPNGNIQKRGCAFHGHMFIYNVNKRTKTMQVMDKMILADMVSSARFLAVRSFRSSCRIYAC